MPPDFLSFINYLTLKKKKKTLIAIIDSKNKMERDEFQVI